MGEKVMENNQVTLKGTVETKPEFNHEQYGEKFYLFHMRVKRLSDTTDLIPVVVSERFPCFSEISIGSKICVNGQYRSYNQKTEEKVKTILTVFAREISFLSEDEKDDNDIILEGFTCKNVIFRKTPLGREIADIMLAVNRPYGKTDYIPCVAWGRNARWASTFDVGTKIKVSGRIQSREYKKALSDGTKEKRTAYEVSIKTMECEQ